MRSDSERKILFNDQSLRAEFVFVESDEEYEEETQGKIFCLPAGRVYGLDMPLREKTLRTLYRAGEVLASLTALIIFFPVMLAIALVIKLDSPGPALFFQKRVGRSKLAKGRSLNKKDGGPVSSGDSENIFYVPQTFWFIKFRTMYADAKERFPKLYNYNYSKKEIDHIPFKVEKDPRITRAGQWLRSSTLDELPNFWNVLTGDMRLVGPRPEIPEMLPNYRPHQMTKFTVKPGITGLPQINGRGRLTFQRTVAYDLEYVEKKSVFLDLKILAVTVWKVITRQGAF